MADTFVPTQENTVQFLATVNGESLSETPLERLVAQKNTNADLIKNPITDKGDGCYWIEGEDWIIEVSKQSTTIVRRGAELDAYLAHKTDIAAKRAAGLIS